MRRLNFGFPRFTETWLRTAPEEAKKLATERAAAPPAATSSANQQPLFEMAPRRRNAFQRIEDEEAVRGAREEVSLKHPF